MGKTLPSLIVCLLACSADTNIFSLLPQESYRSELDYAQALVNSGEVEAALPHAERAAALNPSSEEAAVLLGMIYLDIAGLGLLDMLDKFQQDAGALAISLQNDGGLAGVRALFEITEANILQMGSLDEGSPAVLLPHCANFARSLMPRLAMLNRAIAVVCPFVASQARFDDPRHNCPLNIKREAIDNSIEINLVWMLSHMFELLVFDGVVNYTDNDSGMTNLQQRLGSLQAVQPTTPAELVQFIADLQATVDLLDAVIPFGDCQPDDPQSQVFALFNDLSAVNQSLSLLPGIPDYLIDLLSSIQARLTPDDGGLREQVQLLRAQVTEGIGASLVSQIDSIEAGALDAEQTAQLCSASAELGAGPGSVAGVPEICL